LIVEPLTEARGNLAANVRISLRGKIEFAKGSRPDERFLAVAVPVIENRQEPRCKP
jgi:hypothetical protein